MIMSLQRAFCSLRDRSSSRKGVHTTSIIKIKYFRLLVHNTMFNKETECSRSAKYKTPLEPEPFTGFDK